MPADLQPPGAQIEPKYSADTSIKFDTGDDAPLPDDKTKEQPVGGKAEVRNLKEATFNLDAARSLRRAMLFLHRSRDLTNFPHRTPSISFSPDGSKFIAGSAGNRPQISDIFVGYVACAFPCVAGVSNGDRDHCDHGDAVRLRRIRFRGSHPLKDSNNGCDICATAHMAARQVHVIQLVHAPNLRAILPPAVVIQPVESRGIRPEFGRSTPSSL